MMSNADFIKYSLETNMFFLRVLKEHALFIEASLPRKNQSLAQEANALKRTLESLLSEATALSYCLIDPSGDIVTKYTLKAENATSYLTGIPIDTNITRAQLNLSNDCDYPCMNPMLLQHVCMLNHKAILATNSIINFKTKILNGMLDCSLFTTNYPLLIDHIRREAKFYVNILIELQSGKGIDEINDALTQEAFWNRIMAEHAKFIRGLLDPSEDELFDIADNFGDEFDELTKKALELNDDIALLPEITKESYELTEKFRDFKVQGTEGLLNCQIKSIILPLLGDHVIREANHYLILLEKLKKCK